MKEAGLGGGGVGGRQEWGANRSKMHGLDSNLLASY